MKVVIIHDTPSYDNTATHEISYKSMTKDKKVTAIIRKFA
jgi:hypothetical protein